MLQLMRMLRLGWLSLLAMMVAVRVANGAEESLVPPLLQAHAHNDYEHPRPLLDALAHGFCSVEADIYLVDGRLLVAHNRSQVKPERTLQALYLGPLRERVRAHGGRVYPNGPGFTLLIDFKTEAEPTWDALEPVLEEYGDMLTCFKSNATETGAVSVILSGNRPQGRLAKLSRRLAAIDGRLPDLDGGDSPHLVPLISDNWTRYFRWRGTGPFPDDEKAKLRQVVAQAHAQGRRVRFWGTPDRLEVWRELRLAEVDLLNADDLAGLEQFLRAAGP